MSSFPAVASRPAASTNPRCLLARVILLVIAGTGIVLRFSGLGWGIPQPIPGDATPYRTSFHLDEHTYISGLLSTTPGIKILEVHDYHWGTLQFYLLAVSLSAARLAGYLPGSWRASYLDWDPLYFPRVYIVGRIASAVAGTLTLLVAFSIGRQLKDADAGLAAAAFLSVAPLHVLNSHFLTSDVTMVFFLLLSFSLFLAWLKTGAWLPHIAGAAALGLAISAKYNAVLLIPVWVAGEVIFVRSSARAGKPAWTAPVLCCGAVLTGFAVGEPYGFVHARALFGTLGRAFLVSSDAAREAMLPWPRLLLDQLQAVARFGMQWSLAVPALAGFLACLVRPTKERLTLAAGILLAFASLAFAGWPMIRYTLPLVCLGSIAAALAVAEMPARASWRPYIAILMCAAPLLVSLAQVRTLHAGHPANRAADWVYQNIPNGSRIGQIWPELPPLDRRRYDLVQLHGVLDNEFTPNDSDRDFLILDNLPIRPLNRDFLVRLHREFSAVAEFRVTPRIGPCTLDEAGAPHDWKYTHPVVTIFARKGTGPGGPRIADGFPDVK